ncbi:MAG: AAA family ATPase, partial [Chloroflexota bacterium]
NDGIYKYELAIEHFEEKSRTRIKYERLWFDSKPLLQFVEGEAQLYRDNHSEGPKFPFDWERSVLATIPARRDNTRLTWFRERLRRFLIVQVNPTLMISESTGEEPDPSPYLENFASWYRYIYQDQAKAFLITQALKEIWERFDNFKFAIAGEQHRILMLSFSGNGDRSKSIEYRFDELSDGERTLVALYTLLYAADSGDYTLLIDEPENFVALPEIQPWLVTLYDLCNEGKLQALLISHHPELIDYLASSAGYWFERQGNTPVRVKRITDSIETGLPVSELVARGWIHA